MYIQDASRHGPGVSFQPSLSMQLRKKKIQSVFGLLLICFNQRQDGPPLNRATEPTPSTVSFLRWNPVYLHNEHKPIQGISHPETYSWTIAHAREKKSSPWKNVLDQTHTTLQPQSKSLAKKACDYTHLGENLRRKWPWTIPPFPSANLIKSTRLILTRTRRGKKDK